MANIPVKITCSCWAKINTWRWLHSEAMAAEKQFLDAHESCKEKSVFDQVFGNESTTQGRDQ